jgi:hypothetical protein
LQCADQQGRTRVGEAVSRVTHLAATCGFSHSAVCGSHPLVRPSPLLPSFNHRPRSPIGGQLRVKPPRDVEGSDTCMSCEPRQHTSVRSVLRPDQLTTKPCSETARFDAIRRSHFQPPLSEQNCSRRRERRNLLLTSAFIPAFSVPLRYMLFVHRLLKTRRRSLNAIQTSR